MFDQFNKQNEELQFTKEVSMMESKFATNSHKTDPIININVKVTFESTIEAGPVLFVLIGVFIILLAYAVTSVIRPFLKKQGVDLPTKLSDLAKIKNFDKLPPKMQEQIRARLANLDSIPDNIEAMNTKIQQNIQEKIDTVSAFAKSEVV